MQKNGKGEELYFNYAKRAKASESDRHYHTTYEIYYLDEGECRYFINDRTYDVKRGDVVFIPTGVIHKTNYRSITVSRLLVNFSRDYVPYELLGAVDNLAYLYRGEKLGARVRELLLSISEEHTRADSYSDGAFRCFVGEILYLLLRSDDERIKSGTESLSDRAAHYIKDNYNMDIGLASAAKMLGVSTEHLSRVFKADTGFGFNEYLSLLRLKRAEEMLRNEPGRSVGEIAYLSGFNDGNYFSYKFKSLYGYAPTEFRRRAAEQ